MQTDAPLLVKAAGEDRVVCGMQFNVAASTPVAALNLVAELQRQWQEREVCMGA